VRPGGADRGRRAVNGAGQGDRGFDIATLLFYAYDLERTREALWERALELSGLPQDEPDGVDRETVEHAG
jgi:hypothetical protein